jgi:hypothetical protein
MKIKFNREYPIALDGVRVTWFADGQETDQISDDIAHDLIAGGVAEAVDTVEVQPMEVETKEEPVTVAVADAVTGTDPESAQSADAIETKEKPKTGVTL